MLSQLAFLPAVRREELLHREKAEEVIAFLGLERYRDTLIANLPYGVRKVVELGRALCIEPKLLLLDEPSSGLNVEETEGMGFWIEDIKKDLGITVIMVEHDMNLVRMVSDRVMALNYGRVHRARHTGRGAEPSRGGARLYRGDGMSCSALRATSARCTSIETFYGPIQAIRGVSLQVDAGPDRHRPRRQRRGENHSPAHDLWRAGSGTRRGAFEGRDIAHMPPDRVMRLGICHVPEGREVFPFLTVHENLLMGAYTRHDKDAVHHDLELCFTLFPGAEGALAPARRPVVGRRAADAVDQPRTDGAAETAAARRTIAWPVADPGHADLPHHPPHQRRAGRRHPAGRAERPHGAAHRASSATCWRSAASSWPTTARQLMQTDAIKEFYLGQKDTGIRGQRRWKRKRLWH